MKDELQLQLASILAGLQDAVKTGTGLASEHLPAIAQQYIVFGRVTSVAAVVGLLALVVAYGVVVRRVWRSFIAAPNKWGDDAFFPVLITTVGGIVPVASVTAPPQVWLLKEIASMFK